MAKAMFNGALIAESGDAIEFEGILYFPKGAVKSEYLEASDMHTISPLKGEAAYFHVVANGKTARNAAYTYVEPPAEAESIRGMIAFWKGVELSR